VTTANFTRAPRVKGGDAHGALPKGLLLLDSFGALPVRRLEFFAAPRLVTDDNGLVAHGEGFELYECTEYRVLLVVLFFSSYEAALSARCATGCWW
jgi:hypothetical protein